MILSEKNTILDWIKKEVGYRTNAYRRAPIEDEHTLFRTAGALQEAERIQLQLEKLLSKL